MTFSAAGCDDPGCIRNSQCPDPLVCRAHLCAQPADSGVRETRRELGPGDASDLSPRDAGRRETVPADVRREAAANDRSGGRS